MSHSCVISSQKHCQQGIIRDIARLKPRSKDLYISLVQAALPTALYPVAFLAGDLALAMGFGAFTLRSPMAVAVVVGTMVAVIVLHNMRK